MTDLFQPETAEQLRDCLRDIASSGTGISLFGRNTKLSCGGSSTTDAVRISTAGLRKILKYEPADLTLSVEAGMPFAELQAELAGHGQILPLDGAFSAQGTVGGIVAANISGPFRRLYGTARDLVIGMRFATLDGKLADTGGMVVKNVAGLDLSKLLIGSYGTLAAIVSVNFKVFPKPKERRTFLFNVDTAEQAKKLFGWLTAPQYRAAAVEVLNSALSAEMSLRGYTVAAAFASNAAVMARLSRELPAYGNPMELGGSEEEIFWQSLQLVSQRVLEQSARAVVVKVYTPVAESFEVLSLAGADEFAQAGAGVARAWFAEAAGAKEFMNRALAKHWEPLVEAASPDARNGLTLWPKPGGDFAIMEGIKRTFDPQGLLNRGRLYDRI